MLSSSRGGGPGGQGEEGGGSAGDTGQEPFWGWKDRSRWIGKGKLLVPKEARRILPVV